MVMPLCTSKTGIPRNDICTISGYRIRLKPEYKTQSQIAHERKLERFMLGLILSVIFSALLSHILFNAFHILALNNISASIYINLFYVSCLPHALKKL